MLQQLSFWLVCVIGGVVVLVVSFLGIREVLQFVSLVLFCQVFGVEC